MDLLLFDMTHVLFALFVDLFCLSSPNFVTLVARCCFTCNMVKILAFLVWASVGTCCGAEDDEATLLQVTSKSHLRQEPVTVVVNPMVAQCANYSERGATTIPDGWSDTTFGEGKGTGQQTKIMHGPWDKDMKEIERTWDLGETTTSCIVRWKSYGMLTRDNEWDRTYINDNLVWEFQMPNKGAAGTKINNEWVGECSGSIKVKWMSEINAAVNDEAWGFNDVEVLQFGCVPPVTAPKEGECDTSNGNSCGKLKVSCFDGIEWNVLASQVHKDGEFKVACADGGSWSVRAELTSPTATTTPCPSILYTELAAKALPDGWFETTVGMGITHFTTTLMHGPWGMEFDELSRSWPVLGGNQCTVSWTSYGMHSRDSERDRVWIEGVNIWEEQMTGNEKQDQTWTGDCDSDGDGLITVKWTSDIDQAKSDESWGFGNVVVSQEGCNLIT